MVNSRCQEGALNIHQALSHPNLTLPSPSSLVAILQSHLMDIQVVGVGLNKNVTTDTTDVVTMDTTDVVTMDTTDVVTTDTIEMVPTNFDLKHKHGHMHIKWHKKGKHCHGYSTSSFCSTDSD